MVKIKQPVALPFLRKQASLDYPANCLFFNPGLSEKYAGKTSDLYVPRLPLPEKMADRLLEEMRQTYAQTELLNHLSLKSFTETLAFCKEMADLAEFAGKKAAYTNDSEIMIHAQKTLIFRWLQEILHEEIRDLEVKLLGQEESLQAILDEDLLEEQPETDIPPFQDSNNAWRGAAESALFFIGTEHPVFCQGQLAEMVTGNLEFSPQIPEGLADLGRDGFLVAKAPAWQAFGFNSGNRYKFLLSFPEVLNNFLENRYWILWKNG